MSDEGGPWRPRRKWRRHRYYKVQYYEERSKTWLDLKPGFDELPDAREFARENTVHGRLRIMWVEGKDRGVEEEVR